MEEPLPRIQEVIELCREEEEPLPLTFAAGQQIELAVRAACPATEFSGKLGNCPPGAARP